MAEQQAVRGPVDYGYVDLRSETERRYWTKELGCSEQQLIDAVSRVGPLIVEVKRHIGSQLDCDTAPKEPTKQS